MTSTVEEPAPVGDTADMTRFETFLDIVSPYLPVLVIGFSLLVVFAIFNVFSLFLLSSSSPGGAVALFSLAFDVVGIVLMGVLIYFCRRHERRKREQG